MGKADDVEQIMRDCLLTDEEVARYGFGSGPEHPPPDPWPEALTLTPGIVRTFVFDRARLEAHRDEVKALLADFPSEFFPKAQGGGDGWSFLNFCTTRDGDLWGQHPNMEALVCLGHALGLCRWEPADRSLWRILPGGVPYVRIDLEPAPEESEG